MSDIGYAVLGTHAPDKLIAGDAKIVTEPVTIASGSGALTRGTVLGRITASKKYTMAVGTASDGSQTPDAILAGDVDATSGDVAAIAYLSGEFNGAALALGAGLTPDGIREVLRDKNIYLK